MAIWFYLQSYGRSLNSKFTRTFEVRKDPMTPVISI